MDAPVVILVGTSHPGNVGAAARGAANFGVTELRFVAPRCDPLAEEARNRAVHAKTLLENAKIYDTLEEALEGISLSVGTTARSSEAANHFLRKPQDVRDWTEQIKGWDGKLALVFGREDTGLTREEVNQLDDLVTIPTADYSSLNLAHAITLMCYETFRVSAESISTERVLSGDTMRAMIAAWDSLTDVSEDRPWRREVAKGVFRKMIGRSMPDDHEVHNIMGILTRTLKRFNHEDWKTPNSEKYLSEAGLLLEEE